ncbi:RTA1-domain-containing protein [Daldinia vernicosa]|uniref:RTA1-domain-containing protein n=1 Tax=Daldinia vernicosa TaxID=114800 RepID=UPI002008E576|nr:RTA1-domain-containing protein [Daldinia vernicosa]KAI0851876.1 RTA1-domain-containing protein [Daldinia vernicosa]
MATCGNPNWQDAQWAFYRYQPSATAAAVFSVLFGITLVTHVAQIYITRTWYLLALVIGCTCECIGYISRIISGQEDPGCWSLGPYIIQSCLILIGPTLMAASIYMILGRIVELTDGESYVLIRRRWLTKVFVGGDVISLFFQSSGGGLMVIGGTTSTIGKYLIIIGLFVQLAFFGAFVVLAGVFHHRMSKAPTSQASLPQVRWQHYLVTLYVTGVMIWVRSLFRVIEYLQGNEGTLSRSEVYLYVFDAALILIAMLWMNWYHPSEIGVLLRGQEPKENGIELLAGGFSGMKQRRRILDPDEK